MMGGLKNHIEEILYVPQNILQSVLLLSSSFVATAQSPEATFDASTKVFRLDGGDVTYAFGVNARGELQQLYWGGRLGAADRIPRCGAGTRVGFV